MLHKLDKMNELTKQVERENKRSINNWQSFEAKKQPEPPKQYIWKELVDQGSVSTSSCPDYYAALIEPKDFIRSQKLDWFQGNVVKYISRCYRKGQAKSDLLKARHFIDMMLEDLKSNEN